MIAAQLASVVEGSVSNIGCPVQHPRKPASE